MRYLLIILVFFSTLMVRASKPLETIDSLKIELEKSNSVDRPVILLKLSEALRFVNRQECYNYGLQAITEAESTGNIVLEARALKSYSVSLYFNEDFTQAIEYSYRALECFRKLKDNEGIAACYNNIGLFYEEIGQGDSSLTNYEKSLYYETIRGDKVGMAGSYYTIGNSYYYKGKLVIAINSYFKGLELMKETDNDAGKAMIYNVIGVIYEDTKEYDKALEFYNKAEDIWSRLEDEVSLARVYINKGELYSQQSKNYKKALEYFTKALEIKTKNNDHTGMALAYNNLGYLYGYMEDYKTALNYLNKSYNLYSEYNYKNGLVMVEYNLGLIYRKLNDTNRAIEHLQNSLKLATDYKLNDYKMPVYEELISIYAVDKTNNDLFSKYFEQYISFKDSVIEGLRYSQFRELENKFKVDELVKDSNQLRNENNEKDLHIYQLRMWFMVIGGVLLFIFFIYILFFRNKS